MGPRLAAAIAVVGLALVTQNAARAADAAVPDRGHLTLNFGAGLCTEHMLPTGVLQAPPPLYLAAELHVRVRQPLSIGVVGGASTVIGWFVGANARVEAHTSPHLFLSFGVGPLLAVSETLRGALLVQGDLSFSIRFTSHVALTLGPLLAIATNDAGTEHCGVDTCDAWSRPGDFIFMLRAGFGGAF